MIGSDDLSADTLATGWTVVAGSASTASLDHMALTASNTMVLLNAQDSASGVEVNASADITAGNSGDTPKIIVKSDGTASNYWYAQLTIGASGTLKLFKVISGTPTQLQSVSCVTSAGTKYSLSVCYGNGKFQAFESVTATVATASVTTNISTQLSAGLACGSITSNVQFKNFTYNHGYSTVHLDCDDCSCNITSDNFNRGDSADIDASSPCGWTVDNGSFSIATNKASTTSTFAAAKCDIDAPNYAVNVSATHGNSSSGRLMMNYVDKDNYYAGEFLGRVRIVKRAAGVETVMRDIEQNFSGASSLCFDTTTNRLWAKLSSGYATALMPAPTSKSVGIGTGATVSGATTFDNFSLDQSSAPCLPCPTCTNCAGSFHDTIELVLAGISGTHVSLNGTYVLSLLGGNLSPSDAFANMTCVWGYVLGSAVDGYKWLYAWPNNTAGPLFGWSAVLTDFENAYGAGTEKRRPWNGSTSSSKPDCAGASGISMASAAPGDPDFASSTATLTVL